MATFANTLNPTPFGFFDSDSGFQTEADAMVTFVKRKLGDDILSVELTKKQIWACFEESFLEYGSVVNQYQAQSQLMNLLGFPTGSALSGSTNIGPHGYEQMLGRENFEFILRQAEPYAMDAGLGGSYNTVTGSISLEKEKQDYDIYTDLKDADGNLIFDNAKNSPKTKLKIMEVFHFSGQAAYRFFDTTSAINYLNNEFDFESFTPETVFYVLPVFEDILRAGQMDLSNRVRRSNYSYRISGTKIRIFPEPTKEDPKKLWIRVAFNPDPFNPDYQDDTIYGVSNLSNVPYGNLQFNRVNSIARQWVRQYTLSACKELLGYIRSKFDSVPIADTTLSLNGGDLVSQGREEKTNLKTELKEMLDTMTYGKLIAAEAEEVESMQRILRNIPIPNGKAIIMG
tara:strand:+ start:8410 stop:9606 length:1197 start_codon:yes stop_codon:yes gene_type:complete